MNQIDIQETEDRLKVLYQQEITFYLTTDYLGELIQQKQQAATTSITGNDSSSGSSGSSSKMMNQHWREVMCEWAYHGEYLLVYSIFIFVTVHA